MYQPVVVIIYVLTVVYKLIKGNNYAIYLLEVITGLSPLMKILPHIWTFSIEFLSMIEANRHTFFFRIT